jgi:hypothetical protein
VSELKIVFMKKRLPFLAAACLLASVAFTSCSKDKNDDSTSTLNVRLTDAPAAVQEVNIDIREVKVKFSEDSSENNWMSLSVTPGIYNLLAYQNGADTLLGTGVFPSRPLKEIRLILGPNNTVKDNGIVYPLVIPSGSESGLKIKLNKSLNASIETVVIDFDAALSVFHEGTGDYKLRPVLRIR